VVVLGPLRRRSPTHMFASASRLQQRRPLRRRSRSGAITRIRTGTKTRARARTFLERREGGHVCEAVQCRSLGLSLSSGRGLERTHTFDRSHRRTCCHQEYKRIINYRQCSNFLCYLGYYTIYYATHTVHRQPWDKRNRRTLFWREPLRTVLYLVYHVL
jgi:hypothetical protein